MKFTFYSDAGHGWLKVKRSVLNEYNVASEISTYSYQKGDYVYLEEDCDAGKLLNAVKAAGVEVEISEVNSERSQIRNYYSFQA